MNVSRRKFLAATIATVSFPQVANSQTLETSGHPASSSTIDFTSREAFDAFDLAWNNGNGNAAQNNENGALGWGEGWLLQAYVVMYQAHRDTFYLDKIITHFDQILQKRDNVRDVADWRGKSLPSWRSVGEYTCGELMLKSAQGEEVLQLRSGARPAERVTICVEDGQHPDTFKIIATYAPAGTKADDAIVDTYDNLTMDAESPDFAVTRIDGEFVNINGGKAGARVMLTAADARADASNHSAPAPLVGVAMQAMPSIVAVQTGHLMTPVATFIRLVNETPALRDTPKYQAKADEYLEALEQAVAVHDYEWRENEEGEGWLHWTKGSPNIFDGCDQPHNQSLSLGRVMIQLAAVTKDPVRKATYLDRARKMATTFKNDLQRANDDTYRWTYFRTKGIAYKGWTIEDDVSESQPALVWPAPGGVKTVEDTCHGVLDVHFALLAYENGLGVFKEGDMKRFARTFVDKMLTTSKQDEPTVFSNVDGSGIAGTTDNVAAAWIMLAPYEPKIFEAMHRNFQLRQPMPGAPAIGLGIAYMNWFGRVHGAS